MNVLESISKWNSLPAQATAYGLNILPATCHEELCSTCYPSGSTGYASDIMLKGSQENYFRLNFIKVS